MLAALPGLYVAARKTWPHAAYVQLLSKGFSRFSSQRAIAGMTVVRRYNRATLGSRELLQRLSSGFYLGLRVVELQLIFLPLLAAGPLALLPRWRLLWYRLVVRTLRWSGPTFIKLGQWAATRPDVLPAEFCQVLAELQSRAPEHSMAWNRHAVERAFGRALPDIFSEFDPVPVGSGSVAQVHRARRRADGREVAVKILHPGVEERFRTDLLLLSVGANLLHGIPAARWLHLPDELHYFAHAMRQQLDLRFEGYTLARFRRNFATSPQAVFPAPLLAAHGVLVESYERGRPIDFFTRAECSPQYSQQWAQLRQEIAYGGFEAFLQMLLWDNFVHADLHPGNMLVRFGDADVRTADDACRAYARGTRPAIVFLDTGLVTELSRRDFCNFTDLFKALVFHADGRLAGRMMIERGPGGPAEVLDPAGFCDSIGALVSPVFSKQTLLHLEGFAISPLLVRVFDLVRQHHVRLEGAFTNLVMSLMCVEGLGRQLSPSLNLRPFLLSGGLRYMASNIADSVAETVDPYL